MINYFIISGLITVCCAWQTFKTLTNITHTAYYDYTLVKFNLSGEEYLILFGGRDERNQPLNDIYQIKLKENTQIKINSSNTPSPRYGSCSLYTKNTMYVYGGNLNNSTTTSQFWLFNISNYSWTQLTNGKYNLTQCKILEYGNSFILLGLNNNTLIASQYDLLSNSWSDIRYKYNDTVEFDSKLWDSTVKRVQLSIEDISDISKLKNPTFLQQNSLTMDTMNAVLIKNTILIINSRAIYSLSLINYTIEFKAMLTNQIDKRQFKSIISGQWLVIIAGNNALDTYLSSVGIYFYLLSDYSTMHYMNQEANGDVSIINKLIVSTNININSVSWPKSIFQFQMFLDNNLTIYIINKTLNIYALRRDCQPNININRCFYGKVFCNDGYTGINCQIPTCKNSLILKDNQNIKIIDFQCSGRGICTLNGCKCFDNWGGEDCSVYQRVSCLYGTKVQNWPILNCQCNSQTIGGNNCQIHFCYNDCSSAGTCESNGLCSCSKGFSGADCSIFNIQFPISASSYYSLSISIIILIWFY